MPNGFGWDQQLSHQTTSGFVSMSTGRPPFVPRLDLPPHLESYVRPTMIELINEIQSNVNLSPLRKALFSVMSRNSYNNEEFINLIANTIDYADMAVVRLGFQPDEAVRAASQNLCLAYSVKMMAEGYFPGIEDYLDDRQLASAREAYQTYRSDMNRLNDFLNQTRGGNQRDPYYGNGGNGTGGYELRGYGGGQQSRSDRASRYTGGGFNTMRQQMPSEPQEQVYYGSRPRQEASHTWGPGTPRPFSKARRSSHMPAGAVVSVVEARGDEIKIPETESKEENMKQQSQHKKNLPVTVKIVAKKPAETQQAPSTQQNGGRTFRELVGEVRSEPTGREIAAVRGNDYRSFLPKYKIPTVYDSRRQYSVYREVLDIDPVVYENIIHKLEGGKVDYSIHENEHLLHARDAGLKQEKVDLAKVKEKLESAMVTTRLESILEDMRRESTVVRADDVEVDTAKSITIPEVLGYVLGGSDFRGMIQEYFAKNEYDFDTDDLAVTATITQLTSWSFGPAGGSADVAKLMSGVSDYEDLAQVLTSIRDTIPSWAWEHLNKELTDHFNELLVIQAGLDVDSLRIHSFYDSWQVVLELVRTEESEECYNTVLTTCLDELKRSTLSVDLTYLMNAANPEMVEMADKTMLSVVENVTLLPVTAAQLNLNCAHEIGLVLEDTTPELYKILSTRFEARLPNCRRSRVILLDGTSFCYWKSQILGGYVISARSYFGL